MKAHSSHWPHIYVAVALTTLATLVLELSLTRIFSVVFYYHFAFLAISIALFGLGAGGVLSYVVADWKGDLYSKLGRLSTCNSLLIVLSVAVVLGQTDSTNNWRLALIYFTTSLPFLTAGAIISLVISETIERVDRVYFFDLLGAAAGCLLLIPFLDALGGPNTTLAVAVLFAAAGAIWFTLAGSVRGRVVAVGLGLLLVALVALNFKTRLLDVKYAKGQKLDNEQFVKWNSFSRISVVKDKKTGAPFIAIDADANTYIANFDFEHLTEQQRHDLLAPGPGLPYRIRRGAKSLIIGPGGGFDVARALASGSHDVTGVEINPIIANTIMKDRFANLSSGIYQRPDTHIVVEDGRSFVRRSQDRYEVIQATLVDTWASTAAGAFALSENNLYTTEAFVDYFQHLTDDGILAFTRWGFDPPRESLRLLSLAMEALARLGEREPWRHVIVAREGSVQGWQADTVVFSRSPFTDIDLSRARDAMAGTGIQPLYVPGDPRDKNAFAGLLLAKDPQQFQREYEYDISPVSDNRPFFFYTVQPRDIWAFLTSADRDSADYKINRAVPLLFALMGVSLLATLVILALPPVVLGTRLPQQKGVLPFLLYFLFIGAGYILVEIALIQKFVLFLGHPTYALWVVIFSMLVSSGLGSFYSRRFLADAEDQRLIKALGIIAVSIAALGLVVTLLLSAAVGLPLPLKVILTVLLIAPVGFVMGMPFPTGLRRLEAWHPPALRWAWSLNAASSVLGSVGALVCAIYLGLMQTLVIGGLLYLGALVVVMRIEPQSRAKLGSPAYSATKL